MIRDSGDRTEFPSGAVRDCKEGKGRFDLVPLDVVADIMGGSVLRYLAAFQRCMWQKCDLDTALLEIALTDFCEERGWQSADMMLEVAKHFEEGARKYGEHNWRRGIPVQCYIDSAVRHYLKWRRGDEDESHDRAFAWNIMCCIWEVKQHDESWAEESPDNAAAQG